MGDERDKQLADLQTVLAVSRDLAAATELTPLLQRIQTAALQVLGCERATVFLYDREAKELYSRVATGVDEIRFGVDHGIAGEVARTGEVVHVDDAYADSRFNRDIDRKTGFHTRNMIAFPLIGFDNTIVGVLQVLNKESGSFDGWDRRLVETLGAQIGVVVQRQLLLDQYAEKQRIQADLNIARGIQQALLPKEAPNVPGFDIAGWNEPADETGGDCYDFFMLEDGAAAITIADATGHGIGPALMIAECRALFRSTILLSRDLAQVAGQVNNLLCDDLPSDRFVTAFFGIVSSASRSFSFISAGHGPLIKYVRKTDEIAEVKPTMFPLGIMRDQVFAAPDEFQMESGDMMVLVTDGFTEWANAGREQFGTARLCRVVRDNRGCGASELIARLRDAVKSFAAGTHQADDLTAVVVKKL
jgi:phosphoserine phosphatase RsbU/P